MFFGGFLFVSLKLSPLHQKCDSGNWLQVCLFYCSETEDLARRIAAETDSIELKSIKWGFVPFLYTSFSFSFYFVLKLLCKISTEILVLLGTN
jgi:hypothetical protein